MQLNYNHSQQTLILHNTDNESDPRTNIRINCKINNTETINILSNEIDNIFKMQICLSINNNNRYWNKIYISNDSSKLNLLIFLQNPSDDLKVGTLKKLIHKFIEDDKYIDKIYTITFINVYSKIDKNINNWINLNFDNEILTNEEKQNIDALQILLLINNYNECYIGPGQHICSFGLKGTHIKKYFLITYTKIVNMMLNKITIFKGFGNFSSYHIPDYPYSRKTKYNPIFIDIPINLLREKTNKIKF